jgi:hypothetical protein
MILKEFYLEFASAKSNISLVFTKMMLELSKGGEDLIEIDSLLDEHV